MKKKLLLITSFLVAAISGFAADGTLSVTNVKNAVSGATGSLDIVLSGTDRQYVGFQFDLTLPDGLALTTPLTSCYDRGSMLTATHAIVISEHGSNTYRFTGAATPTMAFTAQNGKLLTLYFTAAADATGTLNGSLSTVRMSDAVATSYALADAAFAVTVGNTVMLSEDDTAAPAATSGAVNVTIERQLKANVWNTLVLPFPMTSDQLKTAFGNDVKLAGFEGYTVSDGNINVSFTTSETLAAHTPYIIKVTEAKSSFSVSGVTITEATADTNGRFLTVNHGTNNKPKAMIGTYVAETTIPNNCLFIIDNQFKYSKGNSKLNAYHAYFSFDDFDYEASAPSLTIDVFDMTTGVNQAGHDSVSEGSTYNLQGHRIDESAKGIQIRAGKKVLKK